MAANNNNLNNSVQKLNQSSDKLDKPVGQGQISMHASASALVEKEKTEARQRSQ